MEKSYNYGLVFLSVVVATAGAYVAVEIAKSVRESTGGLRTLWNAGGALAMGLGIWSMHFVAMLALRVTAQRPRSARGRPIHGCDCGGCQSCTPGGCVRQHAVRALEPSNLREYVEPARAVAAGGGVDVLVFEGR